MAHKNVSVPIIAITPEAEEDDDHNYTTLADALTDMESIDSDDNRSGRVENSRTKLKIKLNHEDDTAVTDTEDVDASDDDVDPEIVPYEYPVTLGNLDLNPGECKETHKIRSRNSRGKKKLHTQSSTVTDASARVLLDNFELCEGTTDVEDCAMSDDDVIDVEEAHLPDHMVDAVISTQIADKLCVSVPEATPTARLTDVEQFDSDSSNEGSPKVIHKRRVKRRRPQNALLVPPLEGGVTDVEMLDSNEDDGGVEIPVAIVKKGRRGNSTDEEMISDTDASYHIRPLPEIPLPKPYRKLITVRDTNDRPIVTITPIDDNYRSEFRIVCEGGTDEEALSDTEALPFADAFSRGPTPELSMFDGSFDDVTESIKVHRRTSLRPRAIREELTDTEEIDMVNVPNRRSKYLSSLTMSRRSPLTDTEDFFWGDRDESRNNSTDLESIPMSDDEYLDEKVDLLRALSTTPISMREMEGDTVLSMEGVGPFSDKSRLNVNRRVSMTREYVSPVPTDTEDVCGSEDGEPPMYLKGGSFRKVCTDTEDAPSDDDETHACANKKKI